MGLRPNQPPAPPRCRHSNLPVPVTVHDTLDGRPEIVRWLCPDCTEETYPPPPRGSIAAAALIWEHPYECTCRSCVTYAPR